MSLAASILAANDRKSEAVTVSEWGNAALELRELSANDREALVRLYNAAVEDPQAAEGATAFVVARGLYDPSTGARVFTDEQINELGAKSFEVLNRLSSRVLELSGLADDSTEVEAGN